MAKTISTFILFLLLCITNVNAKRYGKIFFNEDKIQRLNVQEKKYIKKSVYEVVYYTKVFELMIGEFRKGLSREDSFSIDVKITTSLKDKNSADIEIKLRDLKSNKTLNLVESKKVPRIKVQYTVRKLLFKLFYEENYDEQKDIIIKNEIIPIVDNSSIESDENSDNTEDVNGDESESLASSSNERNDKKNKLNEKNEDIKKKKPRPKKKNKKVEISKFDSPDIDLKIEKDSKVFTPTSFKVNTNIFIHVGQENSTTDSSSIIETKTEIQEIKVDLGSRFSIGDSSNYYEAGLSFGKIIGDNIYGLSPSFLLNLSFAQDLYQGHLYIVPGIEYETFSFAELSSKGEGIVPWNNNLIWISAKGRLHFFNSRLEVYGGYSKGMLGQSDLGQKGEAFPIEGSKVTLGAFLSIYNSFGLGFNIDSSEYLSSASRSFQAKNNSVKLLLTYR